MKIIIQKYKIAILILLAVIFTLWFSFPSRLFDCTHSTVLFDRNGVLLSASVAYDQQWRFPPAGKIPEKFTKSVVNFEDKRFFSHCGIDAAAIARAAILDIRKRRVVSGGSTISMQVIRLSRDGKSRTFIEKFIEMILAFRLELSHSKNEILSLYCSYAPFGGNVVGLEAASWRYFGCEPAKLSWAESAMLAVLPNSPSLIHLGKNRERLLSKRNLLLRKLYNKSVIDSMTYKLSTQEPLPVNPKPLPRLAPHLLDRINKDIMLSDTRKQPSVSRITSTIDVSLQKRVSENLNRHIANLSGNGIHNGAVIILDVKTGTVLAYAGNVTNDTIRENDASVDIITAPRSTGSILKPFLYASELESGELFPDQLVADIPMRIGGFAPQNFNRGFDGAVPASDALARSLNIPAVWMLQDYGIDRFYSVLKSIGMTTLHRKAQDYGLTLILGGAEGRLWDIIGMYAGLARVVNNFFTNNNEYPFFSSSFINKQNDKKGLKPGNAAAQPPIGAGAAWLTLQAMQEVTRPEEESAWEYFTSSHRIAWKTGTSFGFRDAWSVGVTPEYAVGVWIGNADGEGRPGLTGSRAAAPLMFACFDLLDISEWFQCPESDLIPVEVCSKSGYRAGTDCQEKKKALVPIAGRKSKMCPYCVVIHCDSTLKWQVHGNCEPVGRIRNLSWFVLPPSMEWYYRQRHSEYRSLPPLREGCNEDIESKESHSIGIIYPRSNCSIYVPVDIDSKRGKTVFEAAHRRSDAVIYWHIDDLYLGVTKGIHRMECAPEAGPHILTLVDDNGERIERKFLIIDVQKKKN